MSANKTLLLLEYKLLFFFFLTFLCTLVQNTEYRSQILNCNI